MEPLTKYLCGFILPFFLFLVGLVFAIRYKLFYILHPIKAFKSAVKGQKGGFKALSLALAGTLGVGNIVGVASAICAGGFGAVFWMWVSAFFAMSLKYCEVYLAILFRQEKKGKVFGGAPYYIYHGSRKRLGKRSAFFLASIFALLCVLNSLTTGNLVQINAVSSLLPIPKLFFGIIFVIASLVVILGGQKRISSFNFFLIPVLSLFYVILCLFAIFTNLSSLPFALRTIFMDAFSPNSLPSGVGCFSVLSAIRYGVSRGVLSNEAGCGTSPTAHASSLTSSPHSQGCLGILEVFIDTIVLCTLTALVIIISGADITKSPMSLVLSAFESFFGKFGAYSISISSILFAFATVCTQFFYGSESVSFVSKSRSAQVAFTIIFVCVLIIGAVIPMSLMWQISDLTLAIMTIFNLICLVFLFKHTKQKSE